MAERFYLNADDAAILREMVRWYRQSKVSFALTPSNLNLAQTPSVYIAKVPVDGIPALEEEGTGTGLDSPGKVECDIYRIIDDELHDMGITRDVYNLSTSVIDAPYVLVTKTKSGDWVASTGGGGGDGTTRYKQLCRFTLNETLATSDAYAWATITNQYGVGNEHDTLDVNVFNLQTSTPGLYLFYGPSGAAGYAFYDQTDDDLGTASGGGAAWMIIQMQCP